MFLICIVLFSVSALWLASAMVKRQSGMTTGKKMAVFYWFVVIFSLNALFFPFVYWVGSLGLTQLTGNAYQAEIVSFLSEMGECEDDGETYACEKHTPVFEFVLEDGKRLQLVGDIRSTAEPEIGKIVTVLYEDGASKVHERSLRSIGLLIGATVMLAIEGYFLLLMLMYALGYDVGKFSTLGIQLAINGLVPLGAGFMFSAFGYVVYAYIFLNNPDGHPLLVAALCGFFMLALLPLLFHYLKGFFSFLGRNMSSL